MISLQKRGYPCFKDIVEQERKKVNEFTTTRELCQSICDYYWVEYKVIVYVKAYTVEHKDTNCKIELDKWIDGNCPENQIEIFRN